MDWFLYDNGLRHERVKVRFELAGRMSFLAIIKLGFSKKTCS